MLSLDTREHHGMCGSRDVTAALLLQLVLVPFRSAPTDTQFVFAPAPGTELEKRFDFDLRLQRPSFTVNGSPSAPLEYAIRLESSVRSMDRYAKVERGAPRDFVRRYDALSGKWWHDDEPNEILGFHDLNGVEVRFAWDADLREYARTVVSRSLPGCDLSCMVEDMDLRGLLPTAPVGVGERWTAKGPAVIDALWSSTELGLCAASESSIEGQVRAVLTPPLRTLAAEQFRIECAYSSASPTDEPGVHRIDLRVDDRIECDLTELARVGAVAEDWLDTRGPVERLVTRWELVGKGVLDWDTSAGHFTNLELALHVVLEVECLLRTGEERFAVEMHWTGQAEWSASAERLREK